MPLGRGPRALQFLRESGFVDRIPCVRSTMAGRAMSDPFQFLLIDRFGICPALSYSEALSRGSWCHTICENIGLPDLAPTILQAKLSIRLGELTHMCGLLGIVGDAKREILEREEHDFKTTLAWIKAYHEVPLHLGTQTTTFPDYIRRPYWRTPITVNGDEAIELTLVSTLDSPPHVTHLEEGTRVAESPPSVIKIDRLLYHTEQNQLWIVDYKSTDKPPRVRLATCPLEFQTTHYGVILQSLLLRGILQNQLLIDGQPLPTNCTFGGFIHIAFQKPTINFGLRDRPFRLDTTPFQRGPRRGQPRNERVYEGEPLFENYLLRVKDWCLGRGEYLDDAPQLIAGTDLRTGPRVNMSFTYANSLDVDRRHEYSHQLQTICSLATRTPVPSMFYRTGAGAIGYGNELTEMAAFHLSPIENWPEIIHNGRYIFSHRDAHITNQTPEGVVQDPPPQEPTLPVLRATPTT